MVGKVITSPRQCGGPVPTVERSVVLHRRGGASNISIRFLAFRTTQKPVTDLKRPIAVWHEPKPRRPGIPLMRIEVIAILVGLATVEDRSFQFEPAISKA